MTKFYSPNLGVNPEDPFARDGEDKLVRRAYWLGLSDQSIVLAMTQGVGANIPNDQKKAHLNDIGRGHLIDDVCRQEILPPETWPMFLGGLTGVLGKYTLEKIKRIWF